MPSIQKKGMAILQLPCPSYINLINYNVPKSAPIFLII